MGFDYLVFYIESSVICIIILLMILITDRVYSTKQEKQIWFGRAIMTFILYFLSDAFWAAMLSGMFPKVRFFVALFNYTNYIFLGLMGYGMFMFIAASEKMPFRKITWKRNLCFLPVILSVLFITIAYIIDPLFWINDPGALMLLHDGLYPFHKVREKGGHKGEKAAIPADRNRSLKCGSLRDDPGSHP